MDSAYNPATELRVYPDRIEVDTSESRPHRAIWELSHDLDVRSVSMSDGYNDVHRRLEQQNKLGHPLERCPEINNPRIVRIWEPQQGWREVAVTWAAPILSRARFQYQDEYQAGGPHFSSSARLRRMASTSGSFGPRAFSAIGKARRYRARAAARSPFL